VDDHFCDFPGWECVTVTRKDRVFNWSRMWDAGIEASEGDIVVYLDSDRVLPRGYFDAVLEHIDDDKFLFTHDLFNFRRDVSDEMVRMFRDTLTPEILRRDYDRYRDLVWYDPRFQLPCNGPNKGVMSGGTAFTKKTFIKSGGVDPWYSGHGAWADNDYHRQCYEGGMAMVDLGLLELHLYHEKVAETGDDLGQRDLEILSLNNYVRYCRKWGIDFDRARFLARHAKLGEDFVKRVRDHLDMHDSPLHVHLPFVPLMV
jgi:hypothetical protein